MNSNELFPWLGPLWEGLEQRVGAGRLPHALLLQGPGGLGKAAFARHLAARLFCEAPEEGRACGRCQGCTLFEAGSHPDHFHVTLEINEKTGKEKTAIGIDQIRELCRQLSLTASEGGYKVGVIQPADLMTTEAANSLLKTLEEPTDNTVLVLVTERPMRLPATVRSRCQAVRFTAPDSVAALPWLEAQLGEEAAGAGALLAVADGAPLKALELARNQGLAARRAWLEQLAGLQEGRLDPVAVADEWAKDEALRPLHWFTAWIMDMIRLRLGGGRGLRNRDLGEPLAAMAGRMQPLALERLLEKAWEALRLTTTQVNRQLLVEDVLLSWVREARQSRQES